MELLGHTGHTAVPVAGEYVPAAHKTHTPDDEAAGADENMPAGHGKQVADASDRTVEE